MVKSMTAYSRVQKSSRLGRFVLELHSINRKMLDIAVYLPKDLIRFDMDIRKWVGQSVERGQVTARIVLQPEDMSQNVLASYGVQLKALKQNWDQLASSLGYDPEKSVDLSFLLSQLQPTTLGVESEDEEEMRNILKGLIDEALVKLI